MGRLVAVGLAVVLLAGGSAAARGPSERLPPIVFRYLHSVPCGTKACEQDNVAVVNQDGSGLRTLTHNPGHEGEPAWSADHRSIAYVRGRSANSPALIWLMNANGSNQRPFRSRPRPGERQSSPSWAPDGRRIAASVWSGTDYDLVIFDVRTGARRIVQPVSRQLAGIGYPAWSPGGGKLAFAAHRGRGSLQIFVASVRTGRWGQVSHCIEDGCGRSSWSPDGRRLVYAEPDASVIRILDLKSGRLRTIVEHGEYPSWSPDGRWIVFVSGTVLKVVSSAGGKPRRVTRARPNWWSLEPHWSG